MKQKRAILKMIFFSYFIGLLHAHEILPFKLGMSCILLDIN